MLDGCAAATAGRDVGGRLRIKGHFQVRALSFPIQGELGEQHLEKVILGEPQRPN
jgi:hypothetical protein